jgi:hypothetical protein
VPTNQVVVFTKTLLGHEVVAKVPVKQAWLPETPTEILMGWGTVNSSKAQRLSLHNSSLAQAATPAETNRVQDSSTTQAVPMVAITRVEPQVVVVVELDGARARRRARSVTSSSNRTLRGIRLTTLVRLSNTCSRCSRQSSRRRPTRRLISQTNGRSTTVLKVVPRVVLKLWHMAKLPV